jgi:uncharacterized protein
MIFEHPAQVDIRLKNMATVYYEDRFEWDGEKAAWTLAHRGISFQSATEIFDDAHAGTFRNDRHGEARWMAIGMNKAGLVLSVAWTWRGTRHRLISARKSNKKERRNYAEGNF